MIFRVTFAAALAALALLTASAAAQASALANPGFEDGAAGEAPPGWSGSLAPSAAEAAPAWRAVVDGENPRRGEASVRLERVGEAGGQPAFGVVSQTIDAAPYRGRRIRLTGAVRVGPEPGPTGLWLRVDRAGGRLGFFDNMAARPITGTEWADYAIEGDVASDAERIALGLLLQGAGPAWVDDLRIEDLGPAPKVDLFAYLEEALAPLKAAHINSGSADWPAIEGRARTAVGAAEGLGEVHAAIRDVISELGERHTHLIVSSTGTGGAPAEPAMPAHELVQGRFGVVRLPGFVGTPDQAARYTAALREGLTGMAAAGGVCGWIVDLRANTGGNMWPMLNGLDPLLGPGPFGAFRTPAGQLTHWTRGSGGIAPALAAGQAPPAFTLAAADAPLAVLFGPQTGSSGEMTAIAFAGRENSRSFGAASAGLTTANVTLPMSDGALLVITTAYVRDRTGHEYAGAMIPDEAVGAAEAEAAAIRWLEGKQGC